MGGGYGGGVRGADVTEHIRQGVGGGEEGMVTPV